MTTARSTVYGFEPFPCDDCNATGRELLDESDEHGPYKMIVPCVGCEGAGQLRECANCRVVMPAGELYCEGCRHGC